MQLLLDWSEDMGKKISETDILNAKEVHLYNKDTLYIVDYDDEAYGFHRDGDGWFIKKNFWDYFDSPMMLSYFSVISKEEAVRLYKEWLKREV